MHSYGFHPDALLEYAQAASYYAREASPEVAERFVASVESGDRRSAGRSRAMVHCRGAWRSPLHRQALPVRTLLPLDGGADHSVCRYAL